jgi:outer membrane immunogenic protein
MRFARILALGALLTTPAMAADFGLPPVDDSIVVPPAATPFTWTGLYFGAHGGFVWPKSGSELSDLFCERADDPCGGRYRAKLDDGSFFGGVQVGANHQFAGGLVIGAEGDLSFGQRFSGPFWFGDNDTPDDGTIGNIDLHAAGSARLRAGFAMDRWMPFVTGGVAFAKYDASFTWDGNIDTPRFGDGALFGYTVGAGINYAVSNNFILGLEWRGTHYQDDSVGMSNPDLDDETWNFVTRLKTHDVRLSGSLKF